MQSNLAWQKLPAEKELKNTSLSRTDPIDFANKA